MIVVELPIYWQQSKRKNVLVGMNNYRNWHWRTSAKFKLDFAELVAPQLKECVPIAGQFEVSMLLYYKNAVCDPSNITPLIEKVVLDELVSVGLLQGDSTKFHVKTAWEVVGQDRDNPRCVVGVRAYE